MIDQNLGENQTLKNQNEEGDRAMEENYIKKLFDEVELYKQAIQDAKDALASAEQELDETLAAQFKEEDQ